MDLEIRIYGSSALRAKAGQVDRVDDTVRQLAEDMLVAMRTSNGIGLAAEQVGRTEAVFVIDTSCADSDNTATGPHGNQQPEMPIVFVNPEIMSMTGEVVEQEGCLSFPEVYADIKRAEEVTVEFTDLQNRRQRLHASGLLARAVQHEVDHLNGILLVDRMSVVQKVVTAGKLKRLRKQGRSR